jgi:hypothetical protein
MENCKYLLEKDVVGDCNNLPVKNYEQEGVIMNYADILEYTTAEGTIPRGQFNAIVRKVGTKGFSIIVPGLNPFEGTAKTGVIKTTGVQTNKLVKFKFVDAGLTADNIVDMLHNGKFVVVLKPIFQGSDNQSGYEIIGKQSPLYFNASSQDRTGDTDGAWDITLECTEPNAGNYLWSTNKATTEALFQGLKVTVPTGE